MKIGILQADSVRPEFREEFGNYPGMIQLLLEASRDEDEGLTFMTYDVVQGEYPDELTACDGYVITGSASSVYDDEPWIHELRKFVVRLHKTRTKTVGICFGHQMIALALEGVAGAADQGWEVGIHESTVVAAKPFMSPALDKVSLLYSHRDQCQNYLPVLNYLLVMIFVLCRCMLSTLTCSHFRATRNSSRGTQKS